MTREEAIRHIKSIKPYVGRNIKDALDMAIKALEQESRVALQPDTARIIVGKSRGGMTLWYQCERCNEPVDDQDTFCRGCGRRLVR